MRPPCSSAPGAPHFLQVLHFRSLHFRCSAACFGKCTHALLQASSLLRKYLSSLVLEGGFLGVGFLPPPRWPRYSDAVIKMLITGGERLAFWSSRMRKQQQWAMLTRTAACSACGTILLIKLPPSYSGHGSGRGVWCEPTVHQLSS